MRGRVAGLGSDITRVFASTGADTSAIRLVSRSISTTALTLPTSRTLSAPASTSARLILRRELATKASRGTKEPPQPQHTSPKGLEDFSNSHHGHSFKQISDHSWSVLTSEPGTRSNYEVQFHPGHLIFKRLNRVNPPTGISDSDTAPSHEISYIQLREACSCTRCLDQNTSQKHITLGQVYREVRNAGWIDKPLARPLVRFSHPDEQGRRSPRLEILWGEEKDSHISHYDIAKLSRLNREMVRNSSLAPTRIWRTPQDLLRLAQRLTGGKRDFEFDYAQLTDANSQVVEDRLGCLLSQLQTAGIALIKGVPIDTTTGEKSAKAIKEVASWIGPIRHTFYGETWDVINLGKDSKNVAYTNHNLGLHMDLMYFENPPRFQLLHCLRNQVEGGASYFVDSFAVRSRMHKEFPTLHQALSKNRIPFKYKNDGHSLLTNRAIFERSTHGGWTTVAWSPPFQGVTGSPNERVQRDISAKWSDRNQDFLEGVAKFEELINDSAARYQFTMKAGDLVLFDNRRILHARQAFTEYSAEKKKEMGIVDGEVNRWLKGCYIDGDAVWDKLAVLRAKYGKRQKWDWTGDKIAA